MRSKIIINGDLRITGEFNLYEFKKKGNTLTMMMGVFEGVQGDCIIDWGILSNLEDTDIFVSKGVSCNYQKGV